MSRGSWARIVGLSIPAAIGAAVVMGTLGPIGAALYLLLLLAGVNTRLLFRLDQHEHHQLRQLLRKARHR